MAEEDPYILLAEFMDQFRHQENNEHATLNEQVDSLLSSNRQSLKNCLRMDRSPRDEKEFLVFDALVARKKTASLGFCSAFDASCMPPLIRRIEKGMLTLVALQGMTLSGSLATTIFETMLNVGVRRFILYLREDYGSEVIGAFLHYLQESSVRVLLLGCQPGDWISLEALRSLCTGILNSSVKLLQLIGLKVRGENVERRVHEILAEMILDSHSPIQKIQVVPDIPGDISVQALSRALCQHPVIRNLDVSFRVCSAQGQDNKLIFDRNPWWKRLLAMDDLPLNLWPLLLEKADTWKCEASHSRLDILYFLLREKNDVVLRNVRR